MLPALRAGIHAAQRFDFRLNVATPPELAPEKPLKDWIRLNDANVQLHTDPEAMVRDADCVVTDTWVSMGDKDGERRHNLLKPYQVNKRLRVVSTVDYYLTD